MLDGIAGLHYRFSLTTDSRSLTNNEQIPAVLTDMY